MLKDKRNWVFFGLISLYAIYIGYRAYTIPITHDEASSWLDFRHMNLWSCISNYDCWKTANNHWLNSILFQFTCSVFGDGPFALRIGNIASGIGYSIVAFLFVKKFVSGFWEQFAGWMLFCVHFFLIEFFGLARGYGLMVFFILLAVYFLFSYVSNSKIKFLFFFLLSCGLSIGSNFTSLFPVGGLLLAWFFWVVFNRKYKIMWIHGLILFGFLILVFWLIYYPIITLYKNGEFEYGTQSWFQMIIDFFNQTSDFQSYFGNNTSLILFSGYCLILVSTLVYLILNWKTKKGSLVFFAICVSLTTPLLILFYVSLLDGAAPIGRKSLFLFPILSPALVLLLSEISSKNLRKSCAILIVLLFCNHIIRVLPNKLHETREWYFDSYTYEVFKEIDSFPKPVRIGCSWLMHQGFDYYKKAQDAPIEGFVYDKELKIDTSLKFYYVTHNDSIGMAQHNFKLVKSFGSNFLFQNQK